MVDAQAAPKPRNPRRAARGKATGTAASPRRESGSPATATRRLTPGLWRPEVRLALEELIARSGRSSPAYDAQRPPVAVLAWDDAAIVNDAGEAAFLRLVSRAAFKVDDDFWTLVPMAYGRQRLRAAYEEFSGLPPAIWERQPAYHRFRKAFLQGYRELCAKVGRKDCRCYMASLWRGFPKEEAREFARQAIREELGRGPGAELVRGDLEDRFPLTIRRGLLVIPEMKDLAGVLRREGFDVWVADLDAQPVLEAAVEEYGLDFSRALGIQQGSFRDRLDGRVLEPVPIRSGKIEAVVSRVGRAPALVVGASSDDAELLGHGAGLRIFLDRGDEGMGRLARERGWLIQPAFKPASNSNP